MGERDPQMTVAGSSSSSSNSGNSSWTLTPPRILSFLGSSGGHVPAACWHRASMAAFVGNHHTAPHIQPTRYIGDPSVRTRTYPPRETTCVHDKSFSDFVMQTASRGLHGITPLQFRDYTATIFLLSSWMFDIDFRRGTRTAPVARGLIDGDVDVDSTAERQVRLQNGRRIDAQICATSL